MFQKVISTPGFWRSAFSLGIAFASMFVIIKWAVEGFIYGFLVTFGKFRAKIKKEEQKY
jgi:hypothetical protein